MGRYVRALRAFAACTLSIALLVAGGGSWTAAGAAAMGHLTVGGKLDTEAQLLTEMYTQLLRHAGFDVTEKAKLGTNDIVHNAIVSGQIDLYPEFTATGLARLKLTSTHNDQQDYALVKAGYEKQFHITWLAFAPLNDTYGICSTQARAGQLHATKVSDLGSAASTLTVATPPDGQTDPNVLPGMNSRYGFTFGKATVLVEPLTFSAVQEGKADVNVCYTTSALDRQGQIRAAHGRQASVPDLPPGADRAGRHAPPRPRDRHDAEPAGAEAHLRSEPGAAARGRERQVGQPGDDRLAEERRAALAARGAIPWPGRPAAARAFVRPTGGRPAATEPARVSRDEEARVHG